MHEQPLLPAQTGDENPFVPETQTGAVNEQLLKTLLDKREELIGYVRRYLGSTRLTDKAGLAEDVYQDVVERVMSSRASLDVKDPMAYLHMAMRNAAIDTIRREKATEPYGLIDDVDPEVFEKRPEMKPPEEMTPDERMMAAALYQFVFQQRELGGKLLEQDIHESSKMERNLEILRMYIADMPAKDMLQRLQDSFGEMTEYDLDNPTDVVKARNVIYQIVKRMMDRIREAIEETELQS